MTENKAKGGAGRRWMAAAALLAALGAGPSLAATGTVCATCAEPTPGVDVSVFSGPVDWSAVAGAGYGFGIARATWGAGLVDARFAANWSGMGAAGLVRGAYAYFVPWQDPIAQARAYLAAVGPLGDGDLPPILDVEESGGLSPTVLGERVGAWLAAVRAATGRTPIVYTGRYVWNDLLTGQGSFAADLWVAHWGAACPVLPDAWGDWQFWQKGVARGVPGIPGDAYLDVFDGRPDDLRAYARVPAVPEPETWATLLAGLGILGTAARRRRRAALPPKGE